MKRFALVLLVWVMYAATLLMACIPFIGINISSIHWVWPIGLFIITSILAKRVIKKFTNNLSKIAVLLFFLSSYVMSALLISAIGHAVSKGQKNATQYQIEQISIALEGYREANGEYPPDTGPQSCAWYLMYSSSKDFLPPATFHSEIYDPKPERKTPQILDAWGCSVNYKLFQQKRLNANFRLWSYGPDGINDSGSAKNGLVAGDDIGN